MTVDFVAHLTRQMAFSRATFGPGARTAGVLDHIRKELVEVEEASTEPAPKDWLCVWTEVSHRATEWSDIAILGLDGLMRQIADENPDMTFDDVAELAVDIIRAKQAKNELRDWPDWRTADPGKAIEHVRGTHD